MENIIERIARHADIDTRRAMGFPPRKVVIPALNLPFEFDQFYRYYAAITFRDATLQVWSHSCCAIGWSFGAQNHRRYYELDYTNGKVAICTNTKTEILRHPDLNEDGTLRAWRT